VDDRIPHSIQKQSFRVLRGFNPSLFRAWNPRVSPHYSGMNTRTRIAVFLSITLAALCSSAAPLHAGAATVDITPRMFPINMPGGFNANYATNAHDPLHARALVLSDGETKLAMVVVDTLSGSPVVYDEIRALASRKTGIPENRMLISATHTHSGVRVDTTNGPAAEVVYRSVFIDGVAQSIIEAHAALQPASLGHASHPLADEVFNRRWHLKPGKMPLNPFGKLDAVKMNPGRSPDVLDRPAAPTDPDITIISVLNKKRRPLALYANYALHYVGATPRGRVSADYYGEYARLMPWRVRGDKDFVAMMSNGASGDINNIPFTVIRPPREPFEQIRIVARKAADTSWSAFKKITEHAGDVSLGMVERNIELKYRKPSAEELGRAKAILAEKDAAKVAKLPRLAQAYAGRTVAAAARPETVTVKLQAIRIGDLGIATIPFETLVEIGLELKERSPFARTMVVGLANGRHGYLPTPEQHLLGGYETWLGTCNVQEDASVIITSHLLEMLNELHR
jgi:neutral ceramidase